MNVIILTAQSGNVIVPCPLGTQIRIISVVVEVTALGADGDQVNIELRRESQPVTSASSPPLQAGTTRVSAFIGATSSLPLLDKIDPVTGLATYNVNAISVSMGLPDTWWPFELVLLATPQLTTVGSMTVAYEVRSQAAHLARARKARAGA